MLKQGLYEQLINQELKEEIRSAEAAERQRVETGAVDAAESARVLAEYVAKLLEKRLTAVAEESGMEEAEEEQVRLINQMLSTLGSESGKDLLPLTEERRVDQLLSVVNTKNSAFAFQEHGSFPRPGTSLAQSSLFTGSDHEPPMFVELAKEIESADRIDLLVSFVKWSGIRLILEPLKKFTERGHLRIITTSYMGATDVKAKDASPCEVLHVLPRERFLDGVYRLVKSFPRGHFERAGMECEDYLSGPAVHDGQDGSDV